MGYPLNKKFYLKTHMLFASQSTSPCCFKTTDKYAIIEVGGVQKIVQEGRYYSCNRLQAQVGAKVRFGRVLAVKDNGKFHVGAPWVDTASIEADILDNFKRNKILVYKMKPKKHTRSKNGHRQLLTRFLVTKIHLD